MNEEMQNAMHFIINQQAQFAIDIQRLTEGQAKLTEATLANTGMIGRIMNVLDRLVQTQTQFAEAQTRLAETQAHTDAKVGELAERVTEVTERLDAFIVTVEKYIAERRNGKQNLN